MAFSRKGFMLSQSGGKPLATKVFEVDASTTRMFFIGDAVKFDAAGNGKIIPLPTSAAGAGLGVVTALYKKNSDGSLMPLTFNQPTPGGPFLGASQAGYAQVVIDGAARYVAQLDVTASQGLIGSNIDVSAGTPSTAAGISGMNLKGTSIATTTNRSFKIVGIASTEFIGTNRSGDFAAGSGVIVKINAPTLDQVAGV